MRPRLLQVLKHPIAGNAIALYVTQGAVMLFPLITLPFLARVLGPAQLGVLVFVQSFSFLLTLVVDYGFAFSASRDVARLRENPDALAATVAGVQGAKTLLSGVCLIAALIAWPLVPLFRDSPELVTMAFLLALFQGAHPAWYFGGLERIKVLSTVDFTTRLLGVVALVALVDGPEDVMLALWIYVGVIALSTGVLQALMYRRVQIHLPSLRASRESLRSSTVLFVSSTASTVGMSANVFLLGLVVPTAQVAYFAAAEKLVRAVSRLLSSGTMAANPRVTFLIGRGRADRANRLASVSFLVIMGLAVMSALAIIAAAPLIIEVVFGADFASTVPLLRILALCIPLEVCASLLILLWLVPRTLERRTLPVVFAASAVNVVLVLAATPLLGVEAAAWSLVAVESVMVACWVLLIRRSGVLDATEQADETVPPATLAGLR